MGALMYDLSKAYQSIKTGDLELHLRRILYRPSTSEEFLTYGFTCVTFGDDPAAAALELAKRRAARDATEIDELAARQLVCATYVDDAGGGGTPEEVARMRGERLETGEYTGTLPRVLAMGGFVAKALISSGTCSQEEEEALGGKFLGVPYVAKEDEIRMQLRTTIRARTQKKAKGKATEFVEMNDDYVEEVVTGQHLLARRKVLSLVMSQYDPLGLLAPLLVQAKLLLRELYGKGVEVGWDTPLPQLQARQWARLITEAHGSPAVVFPRQLSPVGGEAPGLVMFWDGSLVAHGACVYLRWALPGKEAFVRLVTAKCRVAPLAGATVQRMELQGLTVGMRLVRKVVESLSFVVRDVWVLGDSMCCLMAMRKEGSHFNPYFQN